MADSRFPNEILTSVDKPGAPSSLWREQSGRSKIRKYPTRIFFTRASHRQSHRQEGIINTSTDFPYWSLGTCENNKHQLELIATLTSYICCINASSGFEPDPGGPHSGLAAPERKIDRAGILTTRPSMMLISDVLRIILLLLNSARLRVWLLV